MSNVLSEEEKQKILALGRMGWSLRRIERETGIYRDTAARYLREACIAVRKPGRPGKETAKPAISAAEVTPDSSALVRTTGHFWRVPKVSRPEPLKIVAEQETR